MWSIDSLLGFILGAMTFACIIFFAWGRADAASPLLPLIGFLVGFFMVRAAK